MTVWRRVGDNLGSLAFTLPFLACFVLFLGYPIVHGLIISLHRWSPLAGAGPFVGLKNYVNIFHFSSLEAQYFWQGLFNTVLFVVISVPFLLIVPLLIAYLVYRSPGKSVFRPIYFFPTVLSVTAITAVWSFMLQTASGPVNQLIQLNIPWLVRQPYAWISIDIATVWWTMGFNMVIIYAALTQLPISTLEAANLDGAKAVRTFISVVVPQIRNIISFILVVSTIASFNLLAQPMLMTSGGPNDSTKSLSYFIYQLGFNSGHLGMATAMAYLMGIILAGISFAQYFLGREAV